MDQPPVITRENIQAILKYVSCFEGDIPNAAEWLGNEDGMITIPAVSYSDEVTSLVEDLYENGFIFSFDWPSWQEEAVRLFEEPDLLLSTDIVTLQKLLTVHVRKERFCDGHLASIISNGHLLAILRRLKVLAKEMEEPA